MIKEPVLVGIEPTTGLQKYRLFQYFTANRDGEYIYVFYDEYLQTETDAKVNMMSGKYYIVRNIDGFNGFDNWFNYDVGALPGGTKLGDVLVYAINQTLQSIPIDCPTAFEITEQ